MVTGLLASWLLVAPAHGPSIAAPPAAIATVAQVADRGEEAPTRSTVSRVAAAALGWRALPAAVPGGLMLGGLANVVTVIPLAVGVTFGSAAVLGETSLPSERFMSIFLPVLLLCWGTIVVLTGVLGVATLLGCGVSGVLVGLAALRE